MSELTSAFMPAEIRSLSVTPTERYVLLGIGCFSSKNGMYGSIEWFAKWLNLNRSQVSRTVSKLLEQGLVIRQVTAGGRYALCLNNRKIAKSETNSNCVDAHTSETVQQGPIFEPSDVFKDNYSTNSEIQNKAAKRTSKGVSVTNRHSVAKSNSVTNCHGECDDLSRSSVTICHAYIQSKIQSKYSKYITYGADNFLCTYDDQGRLIDARYVESDHVAAVACEADACIKNNKILNQSQNLNLETGSVVTENCDEPRSCDLACTAPELLQQSEQWINQGNSSDAKSADLDSLEIGRSSSLSGSSSNGATELLSQSSDPGSGIDVTVMEGDSNALRALRDDCSQAQNLMLGNKSRDLSHVSPKITKQTRLDGDSAGADDCAATPDRLPKAQEPGDAKQPMATAKTKAKVKAKATYEPRIKHADILDCLQRVYSVTGAIAEECAQEVEARFGGERNWRWGYRAMTTDDLFYVCYWPVANRFGHDYVVQAQKANGIPLRKFKSKGKTGFKSAKAKGAFNSFAKSSSASSATYAAKPRRLCAQKTRFQIMDEAKALEQIQEAKAGNAIPQFNSEGYPTNVFTLDNLDAWRSNAA